MECPIAQSLFEDYSNLATQYFGAVDILSDLVGAHQDFSDAKRRTDQLKTKCQVARLALENHRAEHNCRAVFTAGAG